jgi:hypothetical protein
MSNQDLQEYIYKFPLLRMEDEVEHLGLVFGG